MSPSTTRRTFCRQLAGATAAGTMLATTPTQPPRAQAIEPIRREVGGSKYKLTLAGYSYRNLLTGKNPQCTLKQFIKDCARFGLEGTEPTSYYFPKPTTHAYLCQLKALAFRLGLSISSTAVGNDFCLPPGQARDAQIAMVKQWIDHAAVLGAPVIRIFSGHVRRGQQLEEARRLAVEAIEQCCRYAGQHGIYLGLENHGGLTTTPDEMLKIIHAVKSPWFGAWMDTGNFHGADVYADLEKIAPYTLHVQVKVMISPAGGKRQPSDFRRLARILGRVGYRGWICLEYEEKEDPRKACPRYIQSLREAFNG